ncbi:MAG: hypothetical protein HY821_22620 [Acidobacteria bacterium]|nr:hypothetical protein [Acidobacteriota bacterium]
MELQKYFRELREKEAEISGKDIYVTSLATGDGGKPGVVTQVPKRLGCQLMVERKARLASEEEVAAFLKEQEVRRAEIDSQVYAQRLQVQVVSNPKFGLREPKGGRE